MKSSVLPPNILKCMSATDRKSLGKGGLLPEEALRKQEVKNERQLQNQIVGLLRLKGIEPIVSRFGKKTTNNVGTPDILFAFNGIARAFEVKLPGRDLDDEQKKMAVRLMSPPNQWSHATVHSIDEAIEALQKI